MVNVDFIQRTLIGWGQEELISSLLIETHLISVGKLIMHNLYFFIIDVLDSFLSETVHNRFCVFFFGIILYCYVFQYILENKF